MCKGLCCFYRSQKKADVHPEHQSKTRISPVLSKKKIQTVPTQKFEDSPTSQNHGEKFTTQPSQATFQSRARHKMSCESHDHPLEVNDESVLGPIVEEEGPESQFQGFPNLGSQTDRYTSLRKEKISILHKTSPRKQNVRLDQDRSPKI
jgi:hypothetical protein